MSSEETQRDNFKVKASAAYSAVRRKLARQSLLDLPPESYQKVAVNLTDTTIPGWMSRAELQAIHEVAARNCPKCNCWIEVGVNRGRSFVCTGLSLPRGTILIGVDCAFWVQQVGNERQNAHSSIWTIHDSLMLLNLLRPDLRIITFHMDSAKAALLISSMIAGASTAAAKLVPSGIFIDAGHDYETTKFELQAYSQMFPTQDGVLMGHDYNQSSWPGVVKAVDEFAERANQKPIVTGSVWQFAARD